MNKTYFQIKIDNYGYDPSFIGYIRTFFKTRGLSNQLTGTSLTKILLDENDDPNDIFTYEFSFRTNETDFEELFNKIATNLKGHFKISLGLTVGICSIGCNNCILYNQCDDDISCDCIANNHCFFRPNWVKDSDIFVKAIK